MRSRVGGCLVWVAKTLEHGWVWWSIKSPYSWAWSSMRKDIEADVFELTRTWILGLLEKRFHGIHLSLATLRSY